MRLDNLKKLRDDHDVAHYSLAEGLEAVEKSFGEAQRVAADVIDAYRNRLVAAAQAKKGALPGDAS